MQLTKIKSPHLHFVKVGQSVNNADKEKRELSNLLHNL